MPKLSKESEKGFRSCIGKSLPGVTEKSQTAGQRRGRKSTLWRRFLLCLAASLLSLPLASASETVRIGVFSLFRPAELAVQAAFGFTLVVEIGGSRFSVADRETVRLRLSGSDVECDVVGTTVRAQRVRVRVHGPGAQFRLSVPGKIDRLYQGELEVHPSEETLGAVVVMDVETAVASAVAAENQPGTPPEALRAQAVASRSFLLANRNRHRGFDLCDTTHCQFLKQPPAADSPAAEAAQTTRGLVLRYRKRIVGAMFFGGCGGKTFSPREVGMEPGNYPFHAVACPPCLRNPHGWQRRIARADAEPLLRAGKSETARIALVRKLGWNAVPGNAYSARSEGEIISLKGSGAGHGVGLCQPGAAGLARQGMSFTEILRHYFPDTTIESKY